MGEVWAATHVDLEAPYAVKLIRAELKDSTVRERLLQEARAAAKLVHPAVVRVFDVGQTGEQEPFIVMELLDGETLDECLERRGRLRGTVAVQTLLPIADALAFAHKRNLVHRDLKPENIHLSKAGEHRLQPKLVDFGVVKIDSDEVPDSKLTQAGTIVGTPDYVSPEQARGSDDVDYRTDVWGFCVLLYQALTGQVPFEAENYNALLISIIQEPHRPVNELAEVDLELSQIIDKGLEKDRDERWQSMEELGGALAQWLLSQGVYEDVSGNGLEARWLRGEGAPRSVLDTFSVHPPPDPDQPGSSRPSAETLERALIDPANIKPSSVGGAAVSTRAPAKSRAGLTFGVLLAAIALGAGAVIFTSTRGAQTDAAAAASQATAALAVSAAASPVSVATAAAPTPTVKITKLAGPPPERETETKKTPTRSVKPKQSRPIKRAKTAPAPAPKKASSKLKSPFDD